MARIVYYVAASLDGFIADSTGGVDWLPSGESNDYGYAEFYAGVEALVMGRRTYDQVAGLRGMAVSRQARLRVHPFSAARRPGGGPIRGR